jgi:hypothetical protein
MIADKTIRRVTDPKQQQVESDRYWDSLTVGERLSAVGEVSVAAYAFAAGFKGLADDDAQRPQRVLTRVERSRS